MRWRLHWLVASAAIVVLQAWIPPSQHLHHRRALKRSIHGIHFATDKQKDRDKAEKDGGLEGVNRWRKMIPFVSSDKEEEAKPADEANDDSGGFFRNFFRRFNEEDKDAFLPSKATSKSVERGKTKKPEPDKAALKRVAVEQKREKALREEAVAKRKAEVQARLAARKAKLDARAAAAQLPKETEELRFPFFFDPTKQSLSPSTTPIPKSNRVASFYNNTTKQAQKDELQSPNVSFFNPFSSFFNATKEFFNTTKDERKMVAKEPRKNSTRTYLSVMQTFLSSRNNNKKDDEAWIPVFPKTRIAPGARVPVTVAGIDLLVIASKDARKLYCIANSCPHLGTPLETGELKRLPVEDRSSGRSSKSPPSEVSDRPEKISGWTELEVSSILQQDGLEDCIVCPLHRTAFALESGEVRGEWCPYPPIIGRVMGTVKAATNAAVFDIRTRGKNVEVRLNSSLNDGDKQKPFKGSEQQ